MDTPTTATHNRRAVANRASRPLGILVADHLPLSRVILEITLENRGFRVWPAGDGQEAVEVYRENQAAIDLVVLDASIGDPEAREVFRQLRGTRPDVCCCVMTDANDPFASELYLDLGAIWTFPRPWPVSRVAEILWRLAEDLSWAPPPPYCVLSQQRNATAKPR